MQQDGPPAFFSGLSYEAARDRARAARHGEKVYPSMQILGGEWVLQRHEGAPLEVITPELAAELNGLEAA